jgi:hypothetical protein
MSETRCEEYLRDPQRIDRASRQAIKSGKDPSMSVALGIQTLYVVVHAHAYDGYGSLRVETMLCQRGSQAGTVEG